MAWALLLAAGLSEIVMAISFKYAEGWTRLGPSALGIATALTSFFLLTLALRALPVGTAYAIWTGMGAVGTAIFGIVLFGEPATAARLLPIALITTGIVLLALNEG
jgi:quaternary ammonium compound-resistance protein SugE